MSISLCLVPAMLCTHLELDPSVFAVLLHVKICGGSSLSITSESFTLMATPLAVDDAVDTGYFIGWFLSELKGS